MIMRAILSIWAEGIELGVVNCVVKNEAPAVDHRWGACSMLYCDLPYTLRIRDPL
jgi:hypothetical protein